MITVETLGSSSKGNCCARTTGITQKQVRNLFTYEEDGSLRWLSGGAGHRKGARAGSKNKGYVRIRIGKASFFAHRIVWLYHHGYLPENDVDHIDRNPMNNRIDNLREVSVQCNVRNCGIKSNNTSGVTGVFWDKSKSKWGAKIVVNQKLISVSRSCSFEEAVFHRLAAEQCLCWDGCNSTSSAFLYVKKLLGRDVHDND